MVSALSICGLSDSAMDAAQEARCKEMLDQILAMAKKMAADLEACNAAFRATGANSFNPRSASLPSSASETEAEPADKSEGEVDITTGTGRNSDDLVSNLVTPSSASLAPSPTYTPGQDVALNLQFGVAKLLDTSHTTPGLYEGAPVATSSATPSDLSRRDTDGNLNVLFDIGDEDVDHLSRLPDLLLRNIVARLPIKDAGRTAVLSRRWSPIWRAAPLLAGRADLAVLHLNSDRFYGFVPRSPDGLLELMRLRRYSRTHPLLATSPTKCSTLAPCQDARVPESIGMDTQKLEVHYGSHLCTTIMDRCDMDFISSSLTPYNGLVPCCFGANRCAHKVPQPWPPPMLHNIMSDGTTPPLKPWPPDLIVAGDQFKPSGNLLVVGSGGLKPKPPWWLLVCVLRHQKQDLFIWLLLSRAGTVIHFVFRKGSKYTSFLSSRPHKMLKWFSVSQVDLLIDGLCLHQLVEVLLIFLSDGIEKQWKNEKMVLCLKPWALYGHKLVTNPKILSQLPGHTREDTRASWELLKCYDIFGFMRSELVMFNSSDQFISSNGVTREAVVVMECAWRIKILVWQCLISDFVLLYPGTLFCFVGSIEHHPCKPLGITHIKQEAITQNSEQQDGFAGSETSRLWVSECLLLSNHDLQLLWDPGGILQGLQATPSQLWQIILFKPQRKSHGATFQLVFCWRFWILVQLHKASRVLLHLSCGTGSIHSVFLTHDHPLLLEMVDTKDVRAALLLLSLSPSPTIPESWPQCVSDILSGSKQATHIQCQSNMSQFQHTLVRLQQKLIFVLSISLIKDWQVILWDPGVDNPLIRLMVFLLQQCRPCRWFQNSNRCCNTDSSNYWSSWVLVSCQNISSETTSFLNASTQQILMQDNEVKVQGSQYGKYMCYLKQLSDDWCHRRFTLSIMSVGFTWDPGGSKSVTGFTTTAWGQAVFQEGEYVTYLLIYCLVDWMKQWAGLVVGCWTGLRLGWLMRQS